MATPSQTHTVKAAGVADTSLALYFAARYEEGDANKNLVVKSAEVVIIASYDEATRKVKYNCADDQATLQAFQGSPYGRETVGRVLSMRCAPAAVFMFMLLQREDGMSVQSTPGTCKAYRPANALLGTAAVAIAASFGHQQFCLEDWSNVSDPEARLEFEFKKYKAGRR